MKTVLPVLLISFATLLDASAFYSAEQGRWLNRDPLDEEQGLNLYKFALNAPLNYVDVDGRANWPQPTFAPQSGGDSVDTSICDNYKDSTCKDQCAPGGYKDDPYPGAAKKCCQDFLNKYPKSDKDDCVAKCLTEKDANCSEITLCKDRKGCRTANHIDCYSQCAFFPWKGIPSSCGAVLK